MFVVPWWLVVAIVAVIGLVVTVVVLYKDAADPLRGHRPALLFVGRFLALVYAALGLIGVIINTIATLVSNTVPVALPVQQYWPSTYPWVTLDSVPPASVVGGGFTVADVMVDGLGMDARILLAAGNAVQGLTFVLIAAVIALMCHRLLGGSPFRPLLARATTWAAIAITVGGIAWQILLDIGGGLASRQVLEVTSWTGRTPSAEIGEYLFQEFSTTGLPEPAFGVTVGGWPLIVGFALAAVAVAFRRSERLQRDTEGLV